jgi:hypothetical protein
VRRVRRRWGQGRLRPGTTRVSVSTRPPRDGRVGRPQRQLRRGFERGGDGYRSEIAGRARASRSQPRP